MPVARRPDGRRARATEQSVMVAAILLCAVGLLPSGQPAGGPPQAVSRRGAVGAAAAAVLGGGLPRPAWPMPAAEEREVMTTIQYPSTAGGKPIGMARRRYTGAGDPRWSYPETELPVFASGFGSSFPYTADDFTRLDEEVDTNFYRFPKLVYHIDEGAVAALAHYYDAHIADGSDILDICSSWVSHYPRDFPSRMGSIVGTGISSAELAANDQLDSYAQADLNRRPKLEFKDKSFDVVTCVVSFDYLTRPLEVMREARRVLRPGGRILLSQSNRCFYTKAVRVWTDDMRDEVGVARGTRAPRDCSASLRARPRARRTPARATHRRILRPPRWQAHLRVLGEYIHFAGGFGPPRALDITPRGPGVHDPMFIVEAKAV